MQLYTIKPFLWLPSLYFNKTAQLALPPSHDGYVKISYLSGRGC